MPQKLHPRAILIDLVDPRTDERTATRRLHELEALTRTYGGITVVMLLQKRSRPDYRTFLGSGKCEEIRSLAKEQHVDLLIINNLLKPKQAFELEQDMRKHKTPLRIWDRIDLILHLFERHAHTREARLQIRLAAVRHMGPRIFGMGMELMQQTGGIGARGIGETNTERMRRHLREQERHIRQEVERVHHTRTLHREHRARAGFVTVSVVGYTNTGKSTLAHALTGKDMPSADALFVTLDTRLGALKRDASAHPDIPQQAQTSSPSTQHILISDTIGFIQNLPTSLIDAFRATLDETIHAQLLLHVIDVTSPYMHEQITEVDAILTSLGVDAIPRMLVFNKCDTRTRIPIKTLRKKYAPHPCVFVSARTGSGLHELTQLLTHLLKNHVMSS